MVLTVFEALKLPIMQTATLVAGGDGLDRAIKWVTIVEVIEDVTRLQEGEFLITTAFGVEMDTDRMLQFVDRLAARNLSGLAIQTGFYLKSIPKEFVDSANRHSLPLIELPSKLNFSMITHELLEQVVNKQFQTLEYSYTVHSELIRLVLKSEKLDVIATELAQRTVSEIVVCDQNGNLLAKSTSLKQSETLELLELIQPMAHAQGYRNMTAEPRQLATSLSSSTSYAAVACPIVASHRNLGYIVAKKHGEGSFGEWDMLAIGHGATVCALELLKQQQIRETEKRLTADFVTELLDPQKSADHNFYQRATHNNFSWTRPHQVTLISEISNNGGRSPSNLGPGLAQTVRQSLGQANIHSLAKEGHNFLMIVTEIDNDEIPRLIKCFQTVADQVQHRYHTHIRVAMGSCYKTDDLHLSYEEALRTLRFGPALPQVGAISSWLDVKPYQFIIEQIESGYSVDSYVRDTLGNLVEEPYLFETLHVLLSTNCNFKETAEKLFVHRHTLRYRVEKILTITGKDINNARDRLQLNIGVLTFLLSQCPPIYG